MAQIVLAFGGSHGPSIQTPPEGWAKLGEGDTRDPRFDYQALLRKAKPGLERELTAEAQGSRYKAAHGALAQLRDAIDAARLDGLSEWRIILRVLMPLSKPAIATNVILTFIWSWNNFLWPLLITRDPLMQTLPLGLARFLSYMEDTTGALYAFAVMVLAPSILVFLMAQKEFIRGLTSGATKG